MEMLVELHLIGGRIYIPRDLIDANHVHEPPPLAPFGSLSYLCSQPHYCCPEEYTVPEGLPAVSKKDYKDTKTLEGSNCFLSMKYGVLTRILNRIKLYRHHRILAKKDDSCKIPGNDLKADIRACKNLLDKVVDELWKNINLGHADKLYYMPTALRDKIFEDNAIVNDSQLKDLSCLYRDGGMPDRSRTFTYLLYESVMGFSLFRVYGAIGSFEPLPSVLDLDLIKSFVKLVDHYPFTSQPAQLQHCKNISKSILSEELRLFLQLNLPPRQMWNWSYMLGVRDPKLAQQIENETHISCVCGAHIEDLFRGVHQHFHAFLGIECSIVEKAQVRIGNLYSSESLKLENMVIEASCSLDLIDRNIGLLSLNLRKLYKPHFPELDEIVKDNYLYAKSVKCIANKSLLSQGVSAALNDVVGCQEILKRITDSAKSSIGQDMTTQDLDIVCQCAENIVRMVESRDRLHAYLSVHMKVMAPNLTALIGEIDGARLIACAGSLENLIRSGTTIEMFGASNLSSSDGGIIWNSDLVARATTTGTKMRMAIALASRCYSAACEDYISGTNSSARGKNLYQEMQDMLHKFEEE